MYTLEQIARIIGESIEETKRLFKYIHIGEFKDLFTVDQVEELRLVQRMHAIGFKEEDVTLVLEGRVTIDDILKLRVYEIENNIQREKRLIDDLDALRKGLSNGSHFVPQLTYGKPFIIDNPQRWVCSIRQRVHTHAINYLLKRLQDKMSAYNLQPSGNLIRIFHDAVPSVNDADMELMYPVSSMHNDIQKNLKLLPKVRMLCLDVAGEYDTLSAGYAILFQWLDDNAYEACGPMHEVFNCGVLTSKGIVPQLQLDPSKDPMIFKVRLCIPIKSKEGAKQ